MSPSEAAPAVARRGALSRAATMLATGFGSGYAPVAPGTAGSLVGLALFWPVQLLPVPFQAGATAVLFLLGVAAAAHVSRLAGIEDPGIVVVDEVVGMWLTLLLVPLTPTTAAAGFLLFRVLDVVKPFPARRLERLAGGWGIMADDVMAGVYANLALRLGLALWPTP